MDFGPSYSDLPILSSKKKGGCACDSSAAAGAKRRKRRTTKKKLVKKGGEHRTKATDVKITVGGCGCDHSTGGKKHVGKSSPGKKVHRAGDKVKKVTVMTYLGPLVKYLRSKDSKLTQTTGMSAAWKKIKEVAAKMPKIKKADGTPGLDNMGAVKKLLSEYGIKVAGKKTAAAAAASASAGRKKKLAAAAGKKKLAAAAGKKKKLAAAAAGRKKLAPSGIMDSKSYMNSLLGSDFGQDIFGGLRPRGAAAASASDAFFGGRKRRRHVVAKKKTTVHKKKLVVHKRTTKPLVHKKKHTTTGVHKRKLVKRKLVKRR